MDGDGIIRRHSLPGQSPEERKASKALYTHDGPGELSLKKLVLKKELLYKEKAILAAILVHSLVPLFGTPWLEETWTIDNMSVFSHAYTPETATVNLRRPYITASLDHGKARLGHQPNGQHSASQEQEENNAMHHRPQIVRLAILLMELLLGDRIQQFYAKHKDLYEKRRSQQSNALWDLATKLLHERQKRYPSRHVFIRVVSECLKLEPFARKHSKERYDDYSNHDVLLHIYQTIIWPLEEDLLKDLKFGASFSENPQFGSASG